jgi:hypothetical protein
MQATTTRWPPFCASRKAIMLHPAPYLTDGDLYADLEESTHFDPDLERLAATVMGSAVALLGDDAPWGPAFTNTALQLSLLCAARLNDTVEHTPPGHDTADLLRILHGLNLLQAFTTQTLQLIAWQTGRRAFAGLADVPAGKVRAIQEQLGIAAAHAEATAGLLKQAHLLLSDAASSTRR